MATNDLGKYINAKRLSFEEIIKAQTFPLQDKITIAVEVLKKAISLSEHNIAIAFSGGKDSEVVADIIERYIPELHRHIYCIFGNTGIEFPESLKFARKYGVEHYGERFKETKRSRLREPELRYEFAKRLIAQIEEEGALSEILKPDIKLKGQKALVEAALKRGYELNRDNCFFEGHEMNFMYCLEQYGAPLLGKAASKLDAHRINIECFLKYSASASSDPELIEYYNTLSVCKFSQHCCKLLKKDPSEKIQEELDVDMIIKGLMASESHTRMLSIAKRGHIFASKRPHIKDGAFYHVSPIGLWTDDDIWDYIHDHGLDYSPLYDIEWTASDGSVRYIERNGCMFCGTDIQFKDNHLAVLRQTHPRAYEICMSTFGYQRELNNLFRVRKDKGILQAMTDQGRNARMIDSIGDADDFRVYRPCAYDNFGEMVSIEGTGLDKEYDPEEDEK